MLYKLKYSRYSTYSTRIGIHDPSLTFYGFPDVRSSLSSRGSKNWHDRTPPFPCPINNVLRGCLLRLPPCFLSNTWERPARRMTTSTKSLNETSETRTAKNDVADLWQLTNRSIPSTCGSLKWICNKMCGRCELVDLELWWRKLRRKLGQLLCPWRCGPHQYCIPKVHLQRWFHERVRHTPGHLSRRLEASNQHRGLSWVAQALSWRWYDLGWYHNTMEFV